MRVGVQKWSVGLSCQHFNPNVRVIVRDLTLHLTLTLVL